MNDYRWFNPSQPQTLQIAVMLGYVEAVLGLVLRGWIFSPLMLAVMVAIAAGSGITPVLSIVATTLETEPDSSVTLIYANRTHRSVMFLEEVEDLKDRYLFIEAIETAKCFEEGVIESAAAANIGSIMGIGYPALTGGTVQFMQGYDGPTGRGLSGFVERARQLAKLYGDRFEPTARLVEMAEKGESFPA